MNMCYDCGMIVRNEVEASSRSLKVEASSRSLINKRQDDASTSFAPLPGLDPGSPEVFGDSCFRRNEEKKGAGKRKNTTLIMKIKHKWSYS